jgi:catechol 2,3-dioxygenase-like lactoylglutathione lyase family enzyme
MEWAGVERPAIAQQVTFLYSRDLATAARFYEQVLALPLVLDQGTCRIYRVAGEAFVGICQRDDAPPPDPSGRPVILTLVSQDVDGWHRYLLDRGVAIENPPTLNEDFNIYHLFCRDPDGYLVEVQRFGDARWPAPAPPTRGTCQ